MYCDGHYTRASLYHWPIPDYMRMETDPFSFFLGGEGGGQGA